MDPGSSSSDSLYKDKLKDFFSGLKNNPFAKDSKIRKKKPKASFNDTEYMKHYSKLQTKYPPLSEWVEGLCKIWPELKSKIEKWIERSKDDDEAAVRIWTWSTNIQQAINFALMMDAYYTFDLKEIKVENVKSKMKKNNLDYKEVIKNSIKFIRRVNTVIIDMWTYNNTKDRVVYWCVNAKLFANVKVGEEFRIVNYLSTTESKIFVEELPKISGSGEENTILTLTIPEFCFNAGKIACYSEYPWEFETLIPPYTSCRLTSKDGNRMHLVVAKDNFSAPFGKYSF
jgi:hypothetical protein